MICPPPRPRHTVTHSQPSGGPHNPNIYDDASPRARDPSTPWFRRWYPKFSTLPRAPTHVAVVIHKSQNQGTIIDKLKKEDDDERRRRRILCSGMLVRDVRVGWAEGYWAPSSSSHTRVSCFRGQDISCIIYGHRDTHSHTMPGKWSVAEIGAKNMNHVAMASACLRSSPFVEE